MTTEEKITALYDKMSAEQDKYREWLLAQTPEEILKHTYEYTVRADILMAMENAELTDAQTDMLLKSEAPLADVFKDFCKREPGYMDIVSDCISERANAEIQKEQEKQSALRKLPVYPYSASYARENGQLNEYHESKRTNAACADAISKAISEHYADYRFDAKSAVKEVVEQFGFDRLMHVCAATVLNKEWDERFSRGNVQWARTMSVQPDVDQYGRDRRVEYVIESHSTLADAFVSSTRKEYLLSQPLTQEEVKSEALSILCKFQDAKEPNSPSGTHFAARVSPFFVERAHGKAAELLSKFLPFQSLSFSTFKAQTGIFAVIAADEDRSKKLKPVRASVLAKLQKPAAAASRKTPVKSKKQQER